MFDFNAAVFKELYDRLFPHGGKFVTEFWLGIVIVALLVALVLAGGLSWLPEWFRESHPVDMFMGYSA